MKVIDFIESLEFEFPNLMELNTENRILAVLFREYVLTKNDLYSYLRDYPNLPLGEVLYKMSTKGYIYIRCSENEEVKYSLTALGIYEVEHRFNQSSFHVIFDFLVALGYDVQNVSGFLRNKLYGYHVVGVWENGDLVDQYLKWCEDNEITPTSEVDMKKLMKE